MFRQTVILSKKTFNFQFQFQHLWHPGNLSGKLISCDLSINRRLVVLAMYIMKIKRNSSHVSLHAPSCRGRTTLQKPTHMDLSARGFAAHCSLFEIDLWASLMISVNQRHTVLV
jgi:hypothetical protein